MSISRSLALVCAFAVLAGVATTARGDDGGTAPLDGGTLDGTEAPTTPTESAEEKPAGPAVSEVHITGRLLESQERLVRFLGLAPGVPYDDDRAVALLRQLGYRVIKSESTADGKVEIQIEPFQIIRIVKVRGNFPYFDDEILRQISLRTGSEIDDTMPLDQRLVEEAQKVERFLERDGYFGSKCEIKALPADVPYHVDLRVQVHLGNWFRLGSVQVRGANKLREGELYSAFDHCCLTWGRFRPSRLRGDARAAETQLRERGYPGARVTPDFVFDRDVDTTNGKVKLNVNVAEKRKVQVEFVGNRRLTQRELRAALTLYSGVGYSRRDIEENAELLQRAYQRRGYFEAKVDFRVRPQDDDSDLIEFYIDEGIELRVRGVDFVSANSTSALTIPDVELKQKAGLETKIFPALGIIGLGEGGYVTTVQLKQDEARIVEYYHTRGFPAATARGEVARDRATFGAIGALGAELANPSAGNNLYVRFFIDEGRHELVDRIDVEFKGEHIKSDAEIKKMVHLINPGKAYTEAAFSIDKESILDLYKSSGRPFVDIAASFDWNPAHDRVVLLFTVDEGNDTRFGEILVRGNFRTRERTILRDLPFMRGDRFDLRKIEAGERNLQNHLLFNSVKVLPVGASAHPREVPILVVVQERYMERFGVPTVTVGVQTDRLPYYYYVGAAYQWNNVFGFGSQLDIRGDFDWTDSFGVSARYSDLYVFGPGWRLDITAFYRRELTRRLGPIEAFGGSIGITRLITRTLRVFGRIDVVRSQLSVGFLRLNGPADQTTLQDNTLTTKLVAGIMWDKRVGFDGLPNPLMPVKGWLLASTAAWAPPYVGDNHFVEISGQAMGLLPIPIRGQNFTLIANVRYDHGFPIGATALPAVERFFAGGDTTTRGYGTDQLKTEIVRSEVTPLGDGSGFRVIPQGGNVRFLSTLELQFPIAQSFLGLPVPWVGAVFWDVGAILSDPRTAQRSDFKSGVGVTFFRLLTPFGPLSLEYAYPLNQTLAEQTWKTAPWYSHFPGRIHFNWGIPLSRF